jgi:uncharacterized protein (DUF2062 family)
MVQASQGQSTALQGVRERALRLVRRALAEHSTPRGIGQSIAVGVFAGCTPVGFHALIALALATAFRLNRLWAFLASRASILPVYMLIALSEVEAGHLVRTGELLHLTPREALARRYDVLTEWLIGTLLVGSALAVATGLVAYACARAWQTQAAAEAGDTRSVEGAPVSSRRLDGPRPPSSESPTSAPPGPSP